MLNSFSKTEGSASGHGSFPVRIIPGLEVAVADVMENYENRYDPGPPRNLAPPGVMSPLVILGSGNPVPNPYRFGPASAVVVNGKPYLFDAGEGVARPGKGGHNSWWGHCAGVPDGQSDPPVHYPHAPGSYGRDPDTHPRTVVSRIAPRRWISMVRWGSSTALTQSLMPGRTPLNWILPGPDRNAKWPEGPGARFCHRHFRGRLPGRERQGRGVSAQALGAALQLCLSHHGAGPGAGDRW